MCIRDSSSLHPSKVKIVLRNIIVKTAGSITPMVLKNLHIQIELLTQPLAPMVSTEVQGIVDHITQDQ